MTFRRHPQLRGLGAGAARSTTVYSPRALAFSQSIVTVAKQLKAHPFLAGTRYDEAHYMRASQQAASLVEAAADMAGTTTLNEADLKQLILGGVNLLYAAGNMLGRMAYEQGAEWRTSEEALIEQINQLAEQINTLTNAVGARGGVSGLGFLPLVPIAIGLLAYYLGVTNATTEVMGRICAAHPDSTACSDLITQNGFNPLKPVSEATGKLTMYVGIGIAVLIGGYLIYAIGPAAGRAAQATRRAGRGRGMRGGPKRVYDLHGPSTYDLEV